MNTNPEQLRWFTQKPGSVDCGAVAIMNAKLWLGEKVHASELPDLVKKLGISREKDGVSGYDLNRWISQKRHLGTQRIVQPPFGTVESLLRRRMGFIMRYLWRIDDRRGGHFVFVCPGYRQQPLVTNPHRLSGKGVYQRCRYFSPSEFKACFKKERIGKRYYPWIWPIVRE